jgi:uncharacterized protein HemY
MTGPEHYAAAESHLALALEQPQNESHHMERAKVHAALANAAATAAATFSAEYGPAYGYGSPAPEFSPDTF